LSNELWNGGAPSGKMGFFDARANNTAHPDYARITAGGGDEWTRLARTWAIAIARMARSAVRTFADRAVPVYAGQAANVDLTERGLSFLSQPAQVAEFGPVSSYIRTLSCAPYLGGGLREMDAAKTPEELLAGLRDEYEDSLAKLPARLAPWRTVRAAYGISHLDAYEWQLHTHGSGNARVKLAANQHPEAGRLLRDQAAVLAAAGFSSAQFLAGTPQSPLLEDVNSWAWALDVGFAGPRSEKAKAVFEMAEAANLR
jgi:hypothetical protein